MLKKNILILFFNNAFFFLFIIVFASNRNVERIIWIVIRIIIYDDVRNESRRRCALFGHSKTTRRIQHFDFDPFSEKMCAKRNAALISLFFLLLAAGPMSRANIVADARSLRRYGWELLNAVDAWHGNGTGPLQSHKASSGYSREKYYPSPGK